MNDDVRENMLRNFIEENIKEFYTFSELIKVSDDRVPQSFMSILAIFAIESIVRLEKVDIKNRKELFIIFKSAMEIGLMTLEIKDQMGKDNDRNTH